MKVLINFYATVSESTVNDLQNFITQQIHIGTQNPDNPLEEIIIAISSSGGSSDHGLLAYNFLKQVNVPKTVIAMGNVDSAAVMIYAAGDKRLTMACSRFLLHEAQTTIMGAQLNATKLKEIASLNERITKDYCKVISMVTGKKIQKVEKDVAQGNVMSSEEAIQYGLVDGLQEEPYVKDLNNLNLLIVNNPKVIPQPPQANGSGIVV